MQQLVLALSASLIVFAGCASSTNATCGKNGCPDLGGGGEVDLSVDTTHDLAQTQSQPDLTPLKMFGDPCMNASECASLTCVFTGLGGVCSRLCPPDCPSGFGCYSVLGGGIDPNQVVDICVPDSNQICSPCAASSECAAGGRDLCLPGPVGGSFCARDCATVGCPGGFTCQTLNVGDMPVKQCVPTTGSCDCHTPTQQGTFKACDITTPFGTCAGRVTCNGGAGWTACAPPSATDTPDATFTDNNCDGIDGDINGGIFIATTGSDAAGCGVSYTTPCRTIGFGITRAFQVFKPNLYVQAGAYNEIVNLAQGISIWGGYDTNWQRGDRGTAGHETRIVGGFDSGEGQYLAVKAQNLAVAATLENLVIQGANASGAGRGSYAVHADNSQLNLIRVTIIAGNGVTGSAGGNGSNAPSLGAQGQAGSGSNADNSCEACGLSRPGGGGKATNSCSGGSVLPNGGDGGQGGTKDSSCSCLAGVCVCNNCNASAGLSGGYAASLFASYYGYPGGGAGACVQGNSGNPGDIFNGGGGNAAGANGALVGRYWIASKGGDGTLGDHGSGGGGGGGAGGCDSGCDSNGAGGGGGGAGGCRAQGFGGGGAGGGGSFGVFAINGSSVTATSCSIQRGNAGSGGSGGIGGRGQSGGAGNSGGMGAGGSKIGGDGGAGAHGGHGGGGAGGSGGISAAFFSLNSTISQTCSMVGGSAGGGGGAGASAPTAPVAERDGNAGAAGTSASVYDIFTCGAAGGC